MKLYRWPFSAMASPCELRLYAESEDQAHAALQAGVTEVRRIEAKYSRYREDSVVSRINSAAGNSEGVPVDEETAGLLDYVDAAFEQSGGSFDITSGVLRRVWDFRQPRLPATADVEAALALIGWQKVQWHKHTIRLPMRGMQLDFGGFGKEYAADRVAALLEQHGVAHGMVDLGGDIRVVGPHPDGSGWRVGIRHPDDAEHVIARVELRHGGIATSGDYERGFLYEGRRYSHLLDPRTGWPVGETPASVSVLGARCLVAGSASTIAMLHGAAAQDWLQALGLPWLIVAQDSTVSGSEHAAFLTQPNKS